MHYLTDMVVVNDLNCGTLRFGLRAIRGVLPGEPTEPWTDFSGKPGWNAAFHYIYPQDNKNRFKLTIATPNAQYVYYLAINHDGNANFELSATQSSGPKLELEVLVEFLWPDADESGRLDLRMASSSRPKFVPCLELKPLQTYHDIYPTTATFSFGDCKYRYAVEDELPELTAQYRLTHLDQRPFPLVEGSQRFVIRVFRETLLYTVTMDSETGSLGSRCEYYDVETQTTTGDASDRFEFELKLN